MCPQKRGQYSFLVITFIGYGYFDIYYFLHMNYADSCQLKN